MQSVSTKTTVECLSTSAKNKKIRPNRPTVDLSLSTLVQFIAPKTKDYFCPGASQRRYQFTPYNSSVTPHLLLVAGEGGHLVVWHPHVVLDDAAVTGPGAQDVPLPGEGAHARRVSGHRAHLDSFQTDNKSRIST